MQIHKSIKYIIILILLSFSFPFDLFAQSAEDDSKSQNLETTNEWRYKVAPYFWLLNLDGTTELKGIKSDVDIGFDEIIENFNIGAMLKAEARKNKYGVFIDALGAILETDDKELSKLALDKFRIEVGVAMLQGGATYRVIDTDISPHDSGSNTPFTLDLLAGFRYTYLDVKLKFDKSSDVGGSFHIYDPFVGFQTSTQFSNNFNFNLYGDIGGFNLDFASKFTWQILATIGYKFSIHSDRKNSNFVVGYRTLYQDYEDGSGDDKFDWDVYWHGPIIGLVTTSRRTRKNSTVHTT